MNKIYEKDIYYQQAKIEVDEFIQQEKFKRERDQRLKKLTIDTGDNFV